MNTPPVLPEGAVIITPNEMYREMQDIGRKVDHLTAVIDPSLMHLQTIGAENKANIQALNSRLVTLEHWRWFVLGVAAIAAAAVPTLVTLILNGVF